MRKLKDKVWFIDDNKIQCGIISAVKQHLENGLKEKSNRDSFTMYDVVDEINERDILIDTFGRRLFESKEDLMKFLGGD